METIDEDARLLIMARKGIVIGDGYAQIKALVRELDGRPTAVEVQISDIDQYVVRSPWRATTRLPVGKLYELTVEFGDERFVFLNATLTENPRVTSEHDIVWERGMEPTVVVTHKTHMRRRRR